MTEQNDKIREFENLVNALQSGEVDAVVLHEADGARIATLQSDEPLYRKIVDTLPQCVATVLTDGTIVYLNRRLATMIGASAETLLGANLLTVVVEKDRAELTKLIRRTLLEPQEGGVSFRWATGEAPALVSATRLPVSGVDAIALVIVDVSDQVARHAAEETIRAKDDLLASVSHELRTPLTSIMGWVQLLEQEVAANPHLEMPLRNLKNAVMAETKIVDDLLDLSRSDTGLVSLAMQEFDLRETLRMAVSFVTLQAQNKGIDLHVDVTNAACIVRGDTHRLRQVFVNLLSNALKFTQQGQVSVYARMEEESAVVEVRDTGIGISSEFLPMVFDPFRRSDDARGYPGLGIGLAIARRLVEAHGGQISVASEGRGCGSTFTVRLPLAN